MSAPYNLIDIGSMDLTSEAGKENALTTLITDLNVVLDLLNQAGSTVPILGTGNTGGLLTASQKLKLTGGPTSNADSLHTHSFSGGGGGLDPSASVVLTAPDSNIAGARVLTGIPGEIALNDQGAGNALTIGLATTPVAAGSYSKVTVDNRGRVINGGSITASDLPAHTHAATDLTSGLIPSARFGTKTVPIASLDPGATTDGWIPTAVGGALVMTAPPSGTGEVNTASNVGVIGQQIFKQKTGPNLEFRGVNGLTGIIASLDTPNNVVSLTPDYGTGTNQIPRGDHTHDTRYYQKSEVDNLVKVLSVVLKTANYTALASDQYIRADSTTAAMTITLPDATSNIGKVLRIKRVNNFLNTVHVVPAGTDKIDALYTDWELWDRNEFVVLIASAGNWEIIDCSGSQAPISVGAIGAGITSVIKPNKQYLIGFATVANGVWTLSGITLGQSVHLTLIVNGNFPTIFAVSGLGRALWPNGITGGVGGAQPPTTVIAGRQDEVYATYNGADTLFSFRGQTYL